LGKGVKKEKSGKQSKYTGTMFRDFDKFFELELSQEIQNIDKLRKVLWNKVFYYSFSVYTLACGFFILILYFFRSSTITFLLAAIFIIASAIFVYFYYTFQQNLFCKIFKEKVIRKMIASLDERLDYHPFRSVDRFDLHFSQIFSHRVSIYEIEDLIKGTINKTKIKFFEMPSMNLVFFVIDFNKNFKYNTIVVPYRNKNIANKAFKGFLLRPYSDIKLVNMDHPEFEKLFKVYGEDNIEALYILTPSLMERIIKLKQKFNNDICLSFRDSRLYVAISNDLNLFEAPHLWGNPDFLNLVKSYHNYLHNCLEIVNDLNLNVRIWGKE